MFLDFIVFYIAWLVLGQNYPRFDIVKTYMCVLLNFARYLKQPRLSGASGLVNRPWPPLPLRERRAMVDAISSNRRRWRQWVLEHPQR